jgi:hypothetical protein
MNPSLGYEVDVVTVDTKSVGAVTTYTFPNVTANHEISVTFKETIVQQYTITATVGENGAISPAGDAAGKVVVNQGATQTFTMTPYTDEYIYYKVKDVQVDGKSLGARTSYTFSNVTGNHEINVTFRGPFVKYEEKAGVEVVEIGIEIKRNVKSIKNFRTVHPNTIADKSNRPDQLLMGLISFVLELADAKDKTAEVIITFTKAAPANANWFVYDSKKGWYKHADATFSADRFSVVLKLTDGGSGDTDGKADGSITDPSGYGVLTVVEPESNDPGDDNCFISTVAGSPNAHTHFGVTSLVTMLMTLLGGAAVFFVRKVRARRSGK